MGFLTVKTLLITNGITLVILIYLYINYAYVFRQLFKRDVFTLWKVKRVPIADIDEAFRLEEFGETLDAEVHFIARLSERAGASDREAWVLCGLAKKSKRIFEFGTASGKTLYLMAKNSPADAQLTTLTLHPDQIKDVTQTKDDSSKMTNQAIGESYNVKFFYQGKPEESKITQLFMDSKALDETQYTEQFDLIFIDGSHMYPYVKSDTEKALKMIKPGGVIVWHDYRGSRQVPDVYRYLNELSKTLPIVHLEDTNLVAYRAPK